MYGLSVCCFSNKLPKGEIDVPMAVLMLAAFYVKQHVQHDVVPDVLTCGLKFWLIQERCHRERCHTQCYDIVSNILLKQFMTITKDKTIKHKVNHTGYANTV